MTDPRNGSLTPFAEDHQFCRVCQGDEDVDLPQLMLELAADAYPELDQRWCLQELDRLADGAASRLEACVGPSAQTTTASGSSWSEKFSPTPNPASPENSVRRRLEILSRYLHEEEGFQGNEVDYYDPRNSYLNEVLQLRQGIPISLSMLYIEIGQRCGLPLRGVCTPAHFMVLCHPSHEPLFVDPFHGGDVLTARQCRDRLEQLLGQTGVLRDEDLRPAGIREITVRMLSNLKAIYIAGERWEDALPVQRRLKALLPERASEQRDLGLVYLQAGQPLFALDNLGPYIKLCSSQERKALTPHLLQAQRLIAELN